MKEFKGAKGNWGCVFTSTKNRGVRNKGGYICTLTKPPHFSGQDERYDNELEEARCNQKLIAASPKLLSALLSLIDPLTGLVFDCVAHEIGVEKANQIEQSIEEAL